MNPFKDIKKVAFQPGDPEVLPEVGLIHISVEDVHALRREPLSDGCEVVVCDKSLRLRWGADAVEPLLAKCTWSKEFCIFIRALSTSGAGYNGVVFTYAGAQVAGFYTHQNHPDGLLNGAYHSSTLRSVKPPRSDLFFDQAAMFKTATYGTIPLLHYSHVREADRSLLALADKRRIDANGTLFFLWPASNDLRQMLGMFKDLSAEFKMMVTAIRAEGYNGVAFTDDSAAICPELPVYIDKNPAVEVAPAEENPDVERFRSANQVNYTTPENDSVFAPCLSFLHISPDDEDMLIKDKKQHMYDSIPIKHVGINHVLLHWGQPVYSHDMAERFKIYSSNFLDLVCRIAAAGFSGVEFSKEVEVLDGLEFYSRGPARSASVDMPPVANVSTVAEFQAQVAVWADKTFPGQTTIAKCEHLLREAQELLASPGDPSEMADVFLLLCHIAHRNGVDLMEAGRQKFEVNLSRKWGEPDEKGVIHHIEAGELPTAQVAGDFRQIRLPEFTKPINELLEQRVEESPVLPMVDPVSGGPNTCPMTGRPFSIFARRPDGKGFAAAYGRSFGLSYSTPTPAGGDQFAQWIYVCRLTKWFGPFVGGLISANSGLSVACGAVKTQALGFMLQKATPPKHHVGDKTLPHSTFGYLRVFKVTMSGKSVTGYIPYIPELIELIDLDVLTRDEIGEVISAAWCEAKNPDLDIRFLYLETDESGSTCERRVVSRSEIQTIYGKQ